MATSDGSGTMQRVGFYLRVKFFVQAWFFKLAFASFFKITRILNASKLGQILPSYTKRYPIRPMLEHRIFVPAGAETPGAKLPLLISIHGGGFILGDPQGDDHINHNFATEYGFLVVSINYRLAPRNPFPGCVHDVAEVIRGVLADPTLPYDPSRVAITGFSAGGNLTLAVAQLPGVGEKVQALIPFYPVLDFTGKYTGEYKTTKDGKPDMLEGIAPLFNWAYIPPGQSLANPLLSPIYASRELLPQRIFFIAAEYDYLVHEASIMAKKLAGLDENEELGFEWEKNGIKWRTVPDVVHAWTHVEGKGDQENERQRALAVLYQEVTDWVKQ